MKSAETSNMRRRYSGGNKTFLCLICREQHHPQESKIWEGFQSAVSQRGYQAISGVIPIDPRDEMQHLIAQYRGKIAGIALKPSHSSRGLAEVLLSFPVKAIPHIIIGHYFHQIPLNACVVDNYGGMYAITEHLIRCGRKRLAFVGDINLGSIEHERLHGFVFACLHQGIRVTPEFIIQPGFEGQLKKQLESLFSCPEPPDALVCLSDRLAARILKILSELGWRVPHDVAVVGFGDDEAFADACEPPLCTVHYSSTALGEIAAHQLINQIEGKIAFTPSVFVLPVRIRIRQSSGTLDESLPEGKSSRDIPFSNFVGVCSTLETCALQPL